MLVFSCVAQLIYPIPTSKSNNHFLMFQIFLPFVYSSVPASGIAEAGRHRGLIHEKFKLGMRSSHRIQNKEKPLKTQGFQGFGAASQI